MGWQEIFAHYSEKNGFVKWNSRFNIHMKRLLPYFISISELLLMPVIAAYSMLIIIFVFCSS